MLLGHEEPAVVHRTPVVDDHVDMGVRLVGVQGRDIGPDIVLMFARLKHLEGPSLSNQLCRLRPHMGREAHQQMGGVAVLRRAPPVLDPVADDVVPLLFGQTLGIRIQQDPVAEDKGRF